MKIRKRRKESTIVKQLSVYSDTEYELRTMIKTETVMELLTE